jgi:hypothetical protein
MIIAGSLEQRARSNVMELFLFALCPLPHALCIMPSAPCPTISPYYWAVFEKSHIFATNFSYKIMSNLLIISSFKLIL